MQVIVIPVRWSLGPALLVFICALFGLVTFRALKATGDARFALAFPILLGGILYAICLLRQQARSWALAQAKEQGEGPNLLTLRRGGLVTDRHVLRTVATTLEDRYGSEPAPPHLIVIGEMPGGCLPPEQPYRREPMPYPLTWAWRPLLLFIGGLLVAWGVLRWGVIPHPIIQMVSKVLVLILLGTCLAVVIRLFWFRSFLIVYPGLLQVLTSLPGRTNWRREDWPIQPGTICLLTNTPDATPRLTIRCGRAHRRLRLGGVDLPELLRAMMSTCKVPPGGSLPDFVPVT